MDRYVQFEVCSGARAERIRLWKQIIHDNFFGMECETGEDELRARVEGRLLDQGSIFRISTSRQTLSRTSALIDRAAEQTIIVAFVLSGTYTIRQGERTATLSSGDMCVLDASQPFDAVVLSDEVEHGVLHVPRAQITRRVNCTDDVAFAAYSRELPLQRLTTTFARGVVGALEHFDTPTLDTLMDQALDLLALMIAQDKRGTVDPSTHKSHTLSRIKAHIKAHLREPDLSIETAAAALGISSRYINALLSSQGTSFGRYVLAERLAGARREILDPRRAHAQITEVAFGWGFNNASHFGRVFKERYGLTPRDTKAEGKASQTGWEPGP